MKFRILTMEKSLQILTKKTKTECEEKYRGLVMYLNALAALNIIEENVDNFFFNFEKFLS